MANSVKVTRYLRPTVGIEMPDVTARLVADACEKQAHEFHGDDAEQLAGSSLMEVAEALREAVAGAPGAAPNARA